MTTQDGDDSIVAKVWMPLGQETDGFYEIAHALARIGDTLRHKEDDALVGRQAQGSLGLPLVLRMEQVRVNGIGDAGNGLTTKKGTLLRLIGQPLTTSDIADMVAVQHLFFLFPYFVGQSFRASAGK